MSIKEQRKRASNSVSSERKKAHPYLFPESEILDFVESLRINDLTTVANRFQVVADLTRGSIDELAFSDLLLIKQIADEDANKRFRRIMKAIIASAVRGRGGINAAHLTASRTVQIAFRWSSEYFAGLGAYRDRLRSIAAKRS